MASFLHLGTQLHPAFSNPQCFDLPLKLDRQKIASFVTEFSGRFQGKEVQAVKSYRLKPNAIFSQKIQYVVYRLWNAVKAVFGRSDWQVARKNLTEVMVKHDVIKSSLPYETKVSLDKIYASLAETSLYFSIDGKAKAHSKDAKAQDALNEKMENTIREYFTKKIRPFLMSMALVQKVDAEKVCDLFDEVLSTLSPIYVDGNAVEQDTYVSFCQSTRAFKPLLEEYLNHSSVQEWMLRVLKGGLLQR